MSDDTLFGNSEAHPYSSSLFATPMKYSIEGAEDGQCELLGTFGIIVQATLSMVSVLTLTLKGFMPGETRTWKVFCLDMWKQLSASMFGHMLNVFLAIYLRILTHAGDGCVWYLMNFCFDITVGMALALCIFKVIDTIAVLFEIEVLKSGVYTSEDISLTEGDPDKHIDGRIWLLQVFVWTSCVFLAKIIVFFQEVTFYKIILKVGFWILKTLGLEGNPDMQLIFVMIVIPIFFNTIQFWVQDNYLKGDKHAAERRAKQIEQKRIAMEQKQVLENRRRVAKDRDLSDFSDASGEDSFVDIQFKGRLIEQIEEGIYNIKRKHDSSDSQFSVESLNHDGEPHHKGLIGEDRQSEALLIKEHEPIGHTQDEKVMERSKSDVVAPNPTKSAIKIEEDNLQQE